MSDSDSDLDALLGLDAGLPPSPAPAAKRSRPPAAAGPSAVTSILLEARAQEAKRQRLASAARQQSEADAAADALVMGASGGPSARLESLVGSVQATATADDGELALGAKARPRRPAVPRAPAAAGERARVLYAACAEVARAGAPAVAKLLRSGHLQQACLVADEPLPAPLARWLFELVVAGAHAEAAAGAVEVLCAAVSTSWSVGAAELAYVRQAWGIPSPGGSSEGGGGGGGGFLPEARIGLLARLLRGRADLCAEPRDALRVLAALMTDRRAERHRHELRGAFAAVAEAEGLGVDEQAALAAGCGVRMSAAAWRALALAAPPEVARALARRVLRAEVFAAGGPRELAADADVSAFLGALRPPRQKGVGGAGGSGASAQRFYEDLYTAVSVAAALRPPGLGDACYQLWRAIPSATMDPLVSDTQFAMSACAAVLRARAGAGGGGKRKKKKQGTLGFAPAGV